MKLSSIAWSLLGLGVPPLAALLCIPVLLGVLGSERFGLLSLIWALTALSGLLDLGIGRATTKLLADKLGVGDLAGLRCTAAAATRLTLLSGLAGAVLVALSLLLDLRGLFRVAQVGMGEFTAVTLLLALMVPLQALSATYRGIAEGLQRFRGISLVRMSLGSANFVAPWLLVQITTDMAWITASLALTRLLALGAFAALARSNLPAASAPTTVEQRRREQGQLLRAGGWLSISAIVSPLLVQADRFAIASLISAAAVTSYVVPFDIVTQLLIIPSALTTVALPSLSRLLAEDTSLARAGFRRWTLRITLLMGVIAAVTGLFLPLALQAWLGNAVPDDSVAIGRWLCAGIWLNAIGAMYYAWLHAQGRFRATATLHLAELPCYALLLFMLLASQGVVGAAIAWVVRVGTDTLALFLLSEVDPDANG